MLALDVIRDLGVRYSVREVAHDPWRATHIAVDLEAEGVATSKFQQTDANMMPASKALYEAVIGTKLTVPMTRELRTHASLTIARHNRRGWRVDRAKREHPNDLIVALAMPLAARGEAAEPVELVACYENAVRKQAVAGVQPCATRPASRVSGRGL